MAFEEFTAKGTRSGQAKVSVWKVGAIGFSSAFVKKHGISGVKYATLFFDKEEKKIGIKFTPEAEKYSIKVIWRAGGASIASRSFLNHYNIDYSETRSYHYEYNDKLNMFIVDLNKEE